MDTRSVTIISYNISFSLYTFRDISSTFTLQAEGWGMGKHFYMLCTCGRVYYWPRGYLVLKTFTSAFPLLSYCIAMQERILNQTMMSTMVSECPALNPHILRRASVVVGRLFGDLPSGDIAFFLLTLTSSTFSRLYLCIPWGTLWRSGLLHWILGTGRCDSFGLPLEPSSSHIFILHPDGDRGCRYP